ncbi:pilus assembly protein [Vibrio profundum]|uniref:TadE/TadG family type IV pilus assembly protein n=1 Tax=Vibrio profundum TaxID=2910247 RepID=UPI003D1129FD
MKLYRKGQQGVAAVEFLITLPVLFILLAGITEIGNAFLTYNTINKMVQHAARYSVVDVYGTTGASDVADHSVVKNMVVYGNAAGTGDAAVPNLTTTDVSVSEAANFVTISVNYTYQPIMGSFNDVMDFEVPLNASAMMYTGAGSP